MATQQDLEHTKVERLNNGAIVIERLGRIVLARYGSEFVTWRVDLDGNAEYGCYFDVLSSAVDNFYKRVHSRHVPQL